MANSSEIFVLLCGTGHVDTDRPGFSLGFVFEESLGLSSLIFEGPGTSSKSPSIL